MFKQFFDEFWPKAVEYVAEQGLSNVKNMKDFEHNLETLRKNLKLLSAKASDVEEEIKNGERSGRKKRKREVEEWLEDVRSVETEVDELGSQVESQGSVIMRLMDGGGKAAQLNMQVERLVQQRLDFGEPMLDARGTREEILLTKGMVGEASNENLETVLKLLESRQVSTIGVYGMGGVGKTTLATHVYNRLVEQSQGRVFWITVSQEFTVRSLQDKIARCLGADLFDEDEEVIRAGRLNRYFTQLKSSVLVLDDVWERIDMSKVGCTFSAEGCRLIITTRSLEVCRQIDCKRLISVVKLCKDEAWKLFNVTLENEAELDPQVEEIAKSMTMLCGGLPLGIITVAGSMKGETAIHMWQNALAELEECVRGQDETGEVEEVFKVLKYSFDRLKRNAERESNGFNMIQHCFLYCSLYPEDYEICRDVLVREFISDALLDERRSRRAQVVQGRSILDKLVNLCLLETCVGYDRKEFVRMHDLVRGMALRICKGKYLVRAGDYSLKEIPNQEEWTEDLEKVSIVQCWNLVCIREGISPDCPKLSTLFLRWNNKLKVIPESFFCKMQGLCTLDLCITNIRMLPNSVSDMTSLKSLLLQGCSWLEEVPYLGKMKALRELNLSGTAIKEAPQGLEELLNLRFLSMHANGLKMLPRGVLLKFGHLQHLHLPLDIRVEIEEIENLKKLEEFGGGVRTVMDFNRFITTRGVHDPCFRIGVNLKNAALSGFEIGKDLRGNNELVLCESNLEDEKVSGQGIVYLTIMRCEGLSNCFEYDLSPVPRSLKKLDIRSCGGIEWIMRIDCQVSPICTLEEIHLQNLDDLKGVVMQREGEEIGVVASTAQPTVFPFLKFLNIFGCKKMRKVGLSALPNLEHLTISDCREVEDLFEEEDEGRDSATKTLTKLTNLHLKNLPRLRKVRLPASRIPNLEVIEIESCEGIEEIFEEEGRDSATTLSKLTVLYLKNLPRLRKVGLPASRVPNLEVIEIESCEGIEEIFEEEGRDSATTLSKLTVLHLENLPRLRKVGLPASRIPNLEVIEIESCEGIEEIFEEIAASTLPKLTNLRFIRLPRLGKVGLPASRVPNLEEISIESCGKIQEIFEDEGRDSATTLSKLTELYLNDLPRLKRVSKATIISNSIQTIWIRKCPRLMNKLPLGFDDPAPPPSLIYISVEREWWESLEWDNPLLPQLLHPFLHLID